MEKHIYSQLKLDKLRRERESEEYEKCSNKPSLTSKTLEITKNSKHIYQRQKEFIHKKKVQYEIKKKEEEEKMMKEFTGKPQINQRSKRLKRSNISQLIKPANQYNQLCKAPKPDSKRKSGSS